MNFWQEVSRRRVYRLAGLYIVGAWLLIQVAEMLFQAWGVPDSALRFLFIAAVACFPIALIFSWFYDITTRGIIRTEAAGETETGTLKLKRADYIILTALLGVGLTILLGSAEKIQQEIETAATATGPIEQPPNSIAVLPFSNRSNREEDQFFTDGIHDDLLTQISKIRAIKTISRTSVMVYRDSMLSVIAIGKELKVSMILEGGVQRAGDQIRINVQLIDAIEDEHIWAETYTRELSAENIFAIQSEIAQTVAAELKVILSPQEQLEVQKLPTQNLAALEAWFQAKAGINTGTGAGLQAATGYLEAAIELDSDFAAAYAALAGAYLDQIYLGGLPAAEQITKASTLVDKALQLDSNLSAPYVALGRLKHQERDATAAEQAYKKAIELNPGNAQAYFFYGRLNQALRQADQAISLYSKALELNPKEDSWRVQLAEVLFIVRRFGESRQIYQEIIQRRPDFALAYWGLSDLQFYVDGDIAATILSGSRHLQLDPNIPSNASLMGFTYEHTGDNKLALQWLSYSLRIAPESSFAARTRAEIHMLRQEYNSAFDEYISIGRGDRTLYYLMESGLKSGRTAEAIEHFEKVYPDLFHNNAKIDASNFTRAYTLARLLKATGNEAQANYLLSAALPFALVDKYEGWIGMHNNWPARIYMLQGNHEATLARLSRNINLGFATNRIATDAVFEPLHDRPEFQEIMVHLQAELDRERQQLRAMESSGEIILPPASVIP